MAQADHPLRSDGASTHNGYSAVRLPTSPLGALLVALLAYYPGALWISAIAPTSEFATELLRAAIFAFVLYNVIGARFLRIPWMLFAPGLLLCAFYTFRFAQNAEQGFHLFASVQQMALILWVSGLTTAILLAGRVQQIRSSRNTWILFGIVALFLIGVFLNSETIFSPLNHRGWIDKVNPISMSVVAISLSLALLFFSVRSRVAVILMIATAAVAVALVLTTGSRGPVLAACIALAAYVLLARGTVRNRLLLIGVPLAVLAAPFVYEQISGSTLLGRFARTDFFLDQSSYLRVLAFTGAWQQFLDNPLLGKDVIEYGTEYYPHNLILETLMSMGLLGGAFLAAHLFFSFRAAIGLLRSKDTSSIEHFAPVLMMLEFAMINVSGTVSFATTYWVSSFVVIALWSARQTPALARPR